MAEHLPPGFRPSTLEERRAFYRSRFRAGLAWGWVRELFDRPVFAVKIAGRTDIYDPRFRDLVERNVKAVYISSVRSPEDLRRKALFYAPEGIYYWRNRVLDYGRCRRCPHKRERKCLLCFSCPNFLGQELVFDVDPENFCRGRFRDFTSFTLDCFYKARDAAVEIYESMEEQYSDVRAVFSGRGFHIHVLDEDAWRLSPEERKELVEGFRGADPWVTRGEAALIRLPYSLNAVVNKEVTPLTKKELEEFSVNRYHSSSSYS
ncbi:TPA: DNA primase [Candidatus Micrarchaeota archaeon]|nr:DNA primase [Candidatus Micrarchaeota archaeon]